jgi:hypothetical protein
VAGGISVSPTGRLVEPVSERDATLIGITNADFPHSPRLVDGLARDRDPIRYEFVAGRIDIVNEHIHRARRSWNRLFEIFEALSKTIGIGVAAAKSVSLRLVI